MRFENKWHVCMMNRIFSLRWIHIHTPTQTHKLTQSHIQIVDNIYYLRTVRWTFQVHIFMYCCPYFDRLTLRETNWDSSSKQKLQDRPKIIFMSCNLCELSYLCITAMKHEDFFRRRILNFTPNISFYSHSLNNT